MLYITIALYESKKTCYSWLLNYHAWELKARGRQEDRATRLFFLIYSTYLIGKEGDITKGHTCTIPRLEILTCKGEKSKQKRNKTNKQQ